MPEAGRRTREHRWWPAELTDRPHQRTRRDWAVDVAIFALAAGYWVFEIKGYPPPANELADQPAWMTAADPWVGVVACLSLWLRRRYPLLLAIAMVPMLIVSSLAAAAAVLTVFSLAVHRKWWIATLAAVPYVALVTSYIYFLPFEESADPAALITAPLMFALPLVIGIAIRIRRQLLVSLRNEVEREKTEHSLRVVEARRAERERIAREMHDVLAHRISLLSMHAGALAYRSEQTAAGQGTPLDPAEVGEAVTAIRDNAQQALTELGDVLQVLRVDDADRTLVRLSGLPRMVDEARSAGQRVTFDPESLQPYLDVRQQAQRTVYRVVQEGLTNARKHAPGAPVTVTIKGSETASESTGSKGAMMEVVVANPLTSLGPSPNGAGSVGVHGVLGLAGMGVGLVGLAERIALDGGSLTSGVANGEFRLTARLPLAS